MKAKNWIIAGIIFALIIGIGIFMFYNNSIQKISKNNDTYQANKTSTTSQTNRTTNENTQSTNKDTNENIVKDSKPKEPIEEQIATFSTKIYDTDPARQNNINLTCTRLNGTIVKAGDTFSFTGTLGPSNESKGYQKADILDNKGNKLKEYGGRKLSD